MSDNDSAAGPFAGLRVVDFGTFVAGSFGASLMGDLGAEVIKIESLDGDPARGIPPFLNGESRFFIGLNRNKRGMSIDVTSDGGREIVRRLVERADVVTENFRPGAAKKLGLDYETLSAINPRIILCAASGFGTRGPLAPNPSFDGAVQALTGIAAANERTTGVKAHSAVLVVDFSTALLALGAVGAALYHRERTGHGQKIELSLMQSALTVMAPAYVQARDHAPEGLVGGYPYRLFETSDGAIFVGVAQSKFWQPLCRALDLEEVGTNPRYAVHAQRSLLAPELNAIFEPRFRELSSEQAMERLSAAGVPCGPVRAVDEFFSHPQVEAMGMRRQVEHRLAGHMHVAGPPFDFGISPAAVQRAAPTLGEHNREVLSELGYQGAAIQELEQCGAIRPSAAPSPATPPVRSAGR